VRGVKNKEDAEILRLRALMEGKKISTKTKKETRLQRLATTAKMAAGRVKFHLRAIKEPAVPKN